MRRSMDRRSIPFHPVPSLKAEVWMSTPTLSLPKNCIRAGEGSDHRWQRPTA
jgi:hypothetical protein